MFQHGFRLSLRQYLKLCSRKWLKPRRSLVRYLIHLQLWQSKTLFGDGLINLNKFFLKALLRIATYRYTHYFFHLVFQVGYIFTFWPHCVLIHSIYLDCYHLNFPHQYNFHVLWGHHFERECIFQKLIENLKHTLFNKNWEKWLETECSYFLSVIQSQNIFILLLSKICIIWFAQRVCHI